MKEIICQYCVSFSSCQTVQREAADSRSIQESGMFGVWTVFFLIPGWNQKNIIPGKIIINQIQTRIQGNSGKDRIYVERERRKS